MPIIKNRNLFIFLPVVLALISLAALGTWGLRIGIDLAGGSLMEVTYVTERPPVEQVRALTAALTIGEVRVQPTGESGYLLRQRDLSDDERHQLEVVLGGLGTMQVAQYTSIGPTIGAELLNKAYLAIAAIVVGIILFIAFAFRQVSEPVSSWKYGVVSIVTLAHDVIVPVGLFALLGHLTGAEVNSLFIVGLLTILGISINDTIVVFDRIRENLRLNTERHRTEAFEDTVGHSIDQTITRSINTSLTVIIVLVSLWVFGPESTRDFSLTLIVGMLAGTYSSICLASPLLVMWEKWSKKPAK